tara:strand:- start:470 stop:610 length:141 start_codon:yes stop_codon:yes gene_type:complete
MLWAEAVKGHKQGEVAGGLNGFGTVGCQGRFAWPSFKMLVAPEFSR